MPLGEVTLSQLPTEHDHALAVDVTSAQSAVSYVPAVMAPVHAPVHWLAALAHLPLEQFESATHTHAVGEAAGLGTGVGESEVVQLAGDPVLLPLLTRYPYPPPPPPPAPPA